MTDKPQHLGQIASINNSIMLLLVDGGSAPRWHGTRNSTTPDGPEGSDWEKVFMAMHPSTDAEREATSQDAAEAPHGRVFVRAHGSETEVVALALDVGGIVDVFAAGDRIVLVEGSYDEDQRTAQPMLDFVASLPQAATSVGTIALPSGALACLPSTASGTPFEDAEVAGRSVEVDLDEETGVLVTVPSGVYDVLIETASGVWGEATCAVLVPR